MDRKDGTEVFIGPLLFKFAGSVVGVKLPVRLSNTHIQLTCSNSIEIINRTTGTLDSSSQPMFLFALIYQTCYGSASRVIDTGNTTGTNSYKGIVGCYGTGRGTKCSYTTKRNRCHQRHFSFHNFPPLFC